MIIGLWFTAGILMLGWFVNIVSLTSARSDSSFPAKAGVAILSTVLTGIMFVSVVSAIGALS